MMKALKSQGSKKLKKKEKKGKARPSCKREDKIESEDKKRVRRDNRYKHIVNWIDKLENMEVILTAEDGISKY